MVETRTLNPEENVVDEVAALREIRRLHVATMLANARHNAAMAMTDADSAHTPMPMWMIFLVVGMGALICLLGGAVAELAFRR